jgi:ribosomal protein S18 acetylase RimI-like enzyme
VPRVAPDAGVRVRALAKGDLEDVVRIDALHTGSRKPAYWDRVFRDAFDGRGPEGVRVAIGAEAGDAAGRRLAGYLLGDVRAFEFGSDACGWVFAVGVDPAFARQGVASALLDEAGRRFRAGGILRVRTMVRRNDVPVLSFFRSNGFVAGPFTQLERDVTDATEGAS